MNLWYILGVEKIESQILIFTPLTIKWQSGTWGITAKWIMKHYFISSLASFTNAPQNSFLEKLSWSHVCAQGSIGNLIPLFAPLHQFESAGPNHLTARQLETSMESFTWESQFTQWTSSMKYLKWKSKSQIIQGVQTISSCQSCGHR